MGYIARQGGYFIQRLIRRCLLQKGQVIVSKKGECHGAKNTGTEDVIFVSIVAPVPADYDPVSSN